MLFLVSQIAFFLLIAAVEGAIIGWLIARHIYSQKMQEAKIIADETHQEKELEAEVLQSVLNKKITEITILQQQLQECQRKYSEIRKENRVQSRIRGKQFQHFYRKDNLKQISGIGHFLEKRLNAMGILSLYQIANWQHSDIKRFEAKIGPFPNRISRDNWVGKAKILCQLKSNEAI